MGRYRLWQERCASISIGRRRYRLMRMHTALHVFCGVVFRDYGALVTGGNMGRTGPGWISRWIPPTLLRSG